jgi:hypothetical protein
MRVERMAKAARRRRAGLRMERVAAAECKGRPTAAFALFWHQTLRLALGELLTTARFVQADLFTFYFASVTRDQAGFR